LTASSAWDPAKAKAVRKKFGKDSKWERLSLSIPTDGGKYYRMLPFGDRFSRSQLFDWETSQGIESLRIEPYATDGYHGEEPGQMFMTIEGGGHVPAEMYCSITGSITTTQALTFGKRHMKKHGRPTLPNGNGDELAVGRILYWFFQWRASI